MRGHWVPYVNAALVGWNVGIVIALSLTIAALAITGEFENPWTLVPIPLVSLAVGGYLGFFVARRSLPWFRRRGRAAGVAWLIALLALTWLSFPRPFMYAVA